MKKLFFLLLLVTFFSNADEDLAVPVSPIKSYNRPPVVPVVVDPQAQQLSRNDVIQATQECEQSGLRASVVFAKRMVSGMMSDIIIDVQCMPKFKYYGN
jgi:hypothetical protein